MRRSRLLLVAGVAVASAVLGVAPPSVAADPAVTVDVGRFPDKVAVDPVTHTAYVLNQGNNQAVNGDGTLSVINGTEVTTRKVGGTPVDVAVDSIHQTAYVAVYNSQSSLLILRNGRSKRVPIDNPEAIAVDPALRVVWVLEAPRLLVKVEHDGTKTTYDINGSFPRDVVVSELTHIPYVLSADGQVSWVSTSGTVFVSKLSPSAQAIAVDNTTGTIYVAHSSYFDGGVSHPALLSVLNGLFLRLVDLGNASVSDVDVDETTGTAAVSLYSINNTAYGQVAIVRNLHARFSTVGGTPKALAYGADGALCVANQRSTSVSIVQNGVVTSVPAGVYPVAAATDSGARLCYVANLTDDTVTEVPMP